MADRWIDRTEPFMEILDKASVRLACGCTFSSSGRERAGHYLAGAQVRCPKHGLRMVVYSLPVDRKYLGYNPWRAGGDRRKEGR